MKKENKDSNGREELEKYVRENCCLHILSLLGQNPDDPITNKDFRYFVTFIADVISQEKEKWEEELLANIKNMREVAIISDGTPLREGLVSKETLLNLLQK